MRRAINDCVRLFAQHFSSIGPIVELGSCFTPESRALADIRGYFPGREFIGCDIRQGPGVDRIEDAEALSFAGESVGAVLLFEILEHLQHPERAVAEARRVLRPDGLLAVSVPFNYRIHGFPTDYRRLTTSGIHTLLEDFPARVVFAVGPRLKPAFVFAVASPTRSAEFDACTARFRGAVEAWASRTRRRGLASVLKERARDFFGALLGRAELGVAFFDGTHEGGYLAQARQRGEARQARTPTTSAAP